MRHVLHHAVGEPSVPDDMYDEVFHRGKLGDWYWTDITIDHVEHRALHILVPDVNGEGQGTLKAYGLRLIEVYPHHAPDNWAEPGTVNGWDGDEDAPTLHPSIFVDGKETNPGWHGFFEKGKLRTA